MTFFTIGYGGRAPADLVALLQKHGIRTVVDVRLRPQNAYMGVFARSRSPDRGIQRLLNEAGLDYVWVAALGNPYMDDADWRAKYAALLQAEGEARTAALDSVAAPLCLLCSEKDFRHCHREQIADYLLATRGWTVEHIV